MADKIDGGAALLPCPFCGGEAGYEEVTGATFAGTGTAWSVGCASVDTDCIAYMMLAAFTRKSEAAEAWNKRAPADAMIRARATHKD